MPHRNINEVWNAHVPPAGRRPCLELWRPYQQDKRRSRLTQSSLWWGDEAQARVRPPLMVSWEDLGQGRLTISCGATAEWRSTAAARWAWVSPPSKRSLSERRGGDCSKTGTATVPATVVELTVGSGPDGDKGSLSGSLTGESTHREHILSVLLQTVYGDGLPLGVRHRHVEQVWWTGELYSNTTPVLELPITKATLAALHSHHLPACPAVLRPP